MTTTKQSAFKRGLAAVLALTMVFSLGLSQAFSFQVNAASSRTSGTPVRQLDVPVEDGVYYADIELMNATREAASMGNTALRGSSSYEAKQTGDTDYRPLIVVKDGKATAILEYMPMGYLMFYGFLLELNSVNTTLFNLSPVVESSTFTPATVLAEHRTTTGEVVFDQFNDPDSAYAIDGSNADAHTRPAGYGHDEILMDVTNQAYPHIVTADATPIMIGDGDVPESAEEYTWDHAAYVSVFVPVMFSISPSTGEQYARLQVDWTSLEKVENPENNVQYQLYLATQIEKGNYTDASYQALQDVIAETEETLSNVWPSQNIEVSTGMPPVPVLSLKQFTDEENAAMAAKLIEAINALEEKGDKSSLDALIAEAEAKEETAYTPNSWNAFQEKLTAAKEVQNNQDAGVTQVTAAVNELTAAMEGLIARADLSSLNQLLDEVGELQESAYTEESWRALQTAITEAKEAAADPNVSQNTIDTLRTALENAVNSLIPSGVLDKNNLEDGVYSVYGEMIKTNRQEKSMSNDAINHTIKLTVEDGKYYLTMDFHGLAYLNKFGYLAELSYYDNGYTYGQYGTVEGTLIPAAVLSTQKNADGSDVYDEFNQAGGSYDGKLYPDQIKFPLVADALADEDGYVPLHVFVPVMEDISAGTGDQDVLLKLDWSTLKKTTEDDPAFEPEEPVEQSPAVDYTDAATGVKVNADKGVFDEGVQIVVSEITKGADYDNAVSSLSDVGKKFKLYDVKFLDADGNEVTPNGTVSISFPIAAGYDSANLAVYRLADGGKVLVRGTVENGYYTVITKTAGTYVLVEKGSTITDAENTANIPQTGNDSNVAVFALPALAAAGMMGVTLVTRKRKSNEA